MASDELSDREKAALLWAEHVTKNTAREENGVYEKVREQFSEKETVDLTLIACFFNFFNRLTDSLKIQIESKSEVEKIKSSVSLDPDNVKKYLEITLRDWPAEFPVPNPDK